MLVVRGCLVAFALTVAVSLAEDGKDKCMESLGAEYGGYLPDSAFTASSSTSNYNAVKGRLNTPRTAWIPKNYQPDHDAVTSKDYLQIDLQRPKTITAVSTQGMQAKLFVRTFSLAFSQDGETFDQYMHGSYSHKIFDGNIDGTTVVKSRLPCPVVARYVRFIPEWFIQGGGIALKAGVYGCNEVKRPTSSVSQFRHGTKEANSITISWKNVQQVGLFTLQYYPAETQKPSRWFSVAIKNETLPATYERRISALSSCTKYKFVLRAYPYSKCGITEVFTQEVLTKESRPPAPQKLDAKNDEPNTLELSWVKHPPGYLCADDITKFKVYYKLDSFHSQAPNIFEVDPSLSAYKITKLQSWQSYIVWMVASSRIGDSDIVKATFSVKGKPPSVPPKIIDIHSPKAGAIYVEWKDPPLSSVNGQIRGYTLNYRMTNSTTGYKTMGLDVIQKKKSYTIGKLDAWKTYQVYVSLFNLHSNIQSEVEEVIVKGDGPGAATTGINTTSHYSSVLLEWDSIPEMYLPVSSSAEYQVFYKEGVITSEADLTESSSKTTQSKLEVLNLKPGANYSFVVAAFTNNNKGPLSEIIYTSTLTGPLPSPVLTIDKSSPPKTLLVTWSLDSVALPPGTFFKVIYKLSGQLDGWQEVMVNDITKRDVKIDDLKAWTSYDVQVILQEKGGMKSASNQIPHLVTDTTPGKAPSNLRAARTGYVSITLAWDEVDPRYVLGAVQSYVVRYGTEKDVSTHQFKTTSKRTMRLGNLTDNTGYDIAVAAKTSEVGVFSSEIYVKTQKIESPSRPEILEVQNVDPYSISIRWKMEYNTSSDLDGSIVFKLENEDTGTVNERDVINVREAPDSKMLSVRPYTRYKIQLKLCVGGVCSEYSDASNIKTMEGQPTKVTNIKVVEQANGIIISWSRPLNVSGVLRKYEMNIRNLDDNGSRLPGFPKPIPDTSSSEFVDKLPANKKLSVEITPFTVLKGPTAVYNFTSPEAVPGPPNVVIITINNGKRAVIRWKAPEHPNGKILGYTIFWVGSKGYDIQFEDKKSRNITSPTLEDDHFKERIDDMVPGTNYEFSIAARTSKGLGKIQRYSKAFATPSAEPLPPPKPSFDPSSVTSSSIIIRLKAGQERNGPIYSYQIIVEEVTSNGNTVSKRKRRDLPPSFNKNTTYVAAEINYNNIKRTPTFPFKVGNKKQYNGYTNHPLKAETDYKVHVRATTKQQNNQILYGPMTTIDLPQTAVAGKRNDGVDFPIPVLVGIVFGIIIIVVVVVVVACYIKKRRRREKDQMNPIEIGLIKVEQHNDDEIDSAPRKRPPSLTGDHPVRADHPPVSASAFPKYVTKLHRNENLGFKSDYSLLEIGKEFSWDTAHLPENKPKNRYANIVAYDHSRVILSKIDGIPGSDYINASYIDGYKRPNAYISTQGPLPNTFIDFWRMVWEARSTSIVMLTNLQEKNKLKCHKYWPDDCTEYGDILVTMARKEYFADFTIKVFKLEKITRAEEDKHEVREVRQFHFTCWPDHGIPRYPTKMINFRRKVRSYVTPDSGPTIVHCSAGVGRSGAYIAIDTGMERAQVQQDVDIFNYIASIRTRRIAMVQTEDQYVFVHDTVLEAVMTGDTRIKVHELKNAIRKLDQIESDLSGISGFEKQWKTLNHTPALPDLNFSAGLQPENMEKNRYSTALPIDNNRVLLEMMNEDVATSYINAAYVDSYKHRNSYILTQSPLPHTVDDFWRMLCEHGSTTLIMLNAIDEGHDFMKFWPEEDYRHFGPIKVECLPEDTNELNVSFNSTLKPLHRTPCQEIVVRNFRLSDTRIARSVDIRFFQYTGWTETRVPNSYRPIINLVTRLDRWRSQSESGPITIMCSDGVGRSGTLAAILHTLERVKVDRVFDAFQTIKSIRIQRPHSVKKLNQYKYVHFAVQEYLTAFEEYTKL
ncbi:receptor-type tyrosine-protein phosphatase S-like isoform X1 [Clytia hemisphaerica]